MNRAFLALGLALSILPVAALADDTSGSPGAPPAPPTAAQRQAMFKTFQAFGQKEQQLHQQFRSQILASLSPLHRTAVANLIGQLAISPNPNPQAAAKQLDVLLSQGEQQRILAAHTSFQAESKTLRDQMRTQLQSEFPAAAQHFGGGHPMNGQAHFAQRPTDAGSILLATLSHSKGMMGAHRGFGFHGGGGPAQP